MATLIRNKKALQKYEVQKRFEAGIELFGFEVKSLRAHHGSLNGAYVSITTSREAYLKNAHIPAYQPLNTPSGYDPDRDRKLLLHKREIRLLQDEARSARLTIVPISMYNKGNIVKVEIALVSGKRKHDKRENIKKKDTERDLKRSLKKNVQL